MPVRPPIIAIVAAKGGTGKTVLAGNLAAAWAAQGKKVLAVDCDPQADLTGDLGVTPTDEGGTLAHVLLAVDSGEDPPLTARYPTAVDGVSLIPSGVALDQLSMGLAAAGADGEDALRAALSDELLQDADLVILDTPPHLGPLTVGAMIAADLVLMPCSAQDNRAIGGLVAAVDVLDSLRESGRSSAAKAAVILRVDPRRFRPRRVSRYMVEALTANVPFELPVLGQVIEHASVHQSTVAKMPVVASNRDSRVGNDFAELADAVLQQLGKVPA